ncbi:unnamed protein product [Trichogramma brassicae]|uniref:Uncharacterized protein n=1 Tax=Trichogramma brassicae TaxID=86971 RepID=A0A6H5I386_9HYME|nr:unnamed protein product [Trichogramma brassicae]
MKYTITIVAAAFRSKQQQQSLLRHRTKSCFFSCSLFGRILIKYLESESESSVHIFSGPRERVAAAAAATTDAHKVNKGETGVGAVERCRSIEVFKQGVNFLYTETFDGVNRSRLVKNTCVLQGVLFFPFCSGPQSSQATYSCHVSAKNAQQILAKMRLFGDARTHAFCPSESSAVALPPRRRHRRDLYLFAFRHAYVLYRRIYVRRIRVHAYKYLPAGHKDILWVIYALFFARPSAGTAAAAATITQRQAAATSQACLCCCSGASVSTKPINTSESSLESLPALPALHMYVLLLGVYVARDTGSNFRTRGSSSSSSLYVLLANIVHTCLCTVCAMCRARE